MAGDVVWLDVLPSMSGFGTKLTQDSTKAAQEAGKKAGKAWESAIASSNNGGAKLVADLEAAERSSAKTVSALAGKISEARAAEKNAAAGVLLAEQKLADARVKYGDTSAQAQAADLRLQAARDKAASSATKYTAAEQALRAAQNEHTQVARQLASATDDLATQVDKQPSRWAKFKESLASSRQAAGEVNDKVEQTGTSMSKMAVIAGAVGGVVSNVFSRVVDSVGALAGEAVTASDATDKFKNTLNFAGLDTKTIDKVTKQARAYADQTVYDLGDIQNITAQLASNGIKNYEGLAEAAGNLNAIAGGNAETFKSVGMVLTQTAGQGKLTTENWNQLADAIPGASGKLQEALKKNKAFTGNFRDAMTAGQITADEFNKALLDLGTQPVAVEAAKSTSTFEGALGNLKATVVGGLSDALTALKPRITGIMGNVSDFAKGVGGIASILISGDFKGADSTFGWAEDSTAVDVLFRIRDGLKTAKDYAVDFAKGLGGIASILISGDFAGAAKTFGWEEDSPQVAVLFKIRDVLGEVKDRAVVALKGFGEFLTGTVIPGARDLVGWLVQNRDWIASVAVAVGAVVVVWKTYQTALAVWQTYTKIATAVQAAFNAVMAVNPIVLVVAAVAALTAGLVYFFTQTETGRKVWADFTGWLGQTWADLKQGLEDAWNAVSGFFTGLWDSITSIVKDHWDLILSIILMNPLPLIINNWSAITGFFAGLWADILARLGSAWTSVGDFFAGLGDRIMAGFSRVWDVAKTVFGWTPLGLIVSNWDTIIDFFKGLPARIGTVASGMWDGLTGAFKQTINGLIRMWNDFHLTLGGGRILGMDIPSITLDTPNIPYLAAGGNVVSPGWAVVGERGPELLSLNAGARVTPLNDRPNAGAGNPWRAGVYIDHAELGGSLDELAAEVDWRSRRG